MRWSCGAECAHPGHRATAEGCQEGGVTDRDTCPVTPQGAVLSAHSPCALGKAEDERLWRALLPV